jgi:tetratricopeptide (TPR) repeat protein
MLPFLLLSQQEPAVLSYDVRGVINERSSEITGNVFVRIKNAMAGGSTFTFLAPRSWTITAIRNADNDPYDLEISTSVRTNFSTVSVELPDEQSAADTLLLNMEFRAAVDSSSLASLFINSRELLLVQSDSTGWLPVVGNGRAERASLEMILPAAMMVYSSHPFDTTAGEVGRTWKSAAEQPVDISRYFTLCGLADPVTQTSYSKDSSFTVTFIVSPKKFDHRLAAAVVQQLNDAMQYFSAVTQQHRDSSVLYAVVGDPTFEPVVFRTEDFIIHRNSPAFGQFDSAALNRLHYNHWLVESAQRYCPPTVDSTALFDDGFAAYLSLRYLARTEPHRVQQERLSITAQALTFFPSGTIASGHRSPNNTNQILSYKGGYFFLMLEYLLGAESFDSVIVRMSRRFSSEPASFDAFREVCEQEYGTPLGWFFDQWLFRSTAPEFVLQWRHERTPRGMTVVTVTIDQRGELFTMPVPVVFSFGAKKVVKRILVEQPRQEFTFTFANPPNGAELDPDHSMLRWLLELRIPAHARTSLQYLSVNRDAVNAEREAMYTLQLDPNNSTGSAPLVYFVLGNSAAAKNAMDQGKEYFLKSMAAGGSAETEKYKLLSLVQYANILETEGNHDEAVTLYRRAIAEGMNNPLLYERAMIKAEMHLSTSFTDRTDAWFELH